MFEILFKYPRETYARSELIYAGTWPDWLLYLIATIAVAGITLVVVQRRRTVVPHRLIIIGVLQLGMLAVVLWVLRLPTLSTERLRDGQNSVALLLDTSASMAYGPASNRFEDAREALLASVGSDADLGVTLLRSSRSFTPA